MEKSKDTIQSKLMVLRIDNYSQDYVQGNQMHSLVVTSLVIGGSLIIL